MNTIDIEELDNNDPIIVSEYHLKAGGMLANCTESALKEHGVTDDEINEIKSDALIRKAANLAAKKYDDIDNVTLGSKKGLKQIYIRKNENAMLGKYSDIENEAIIKNHKKQREAEDKYLLLIDKAYQRVMKLIEKGKFSKAEKALQRLEKFGEATTSTDINNAVSE